MGMLTEMLLLYRNRIYISHITATSEAVTTLCSSDNPARPASPISPAMFRMYSWPQHDIKRPTTRADRWPIAVSCERTALEVAEGGTPTSEAFLRSLQPVL